MRGGGELAQVKVGVRTLYRSLLQDNGFGRRPRDIAGQPVCEPDLVVVPRSCVVQGIVVPVTVGGCQTSPVFFRQRVRTRQVGCCLPAALVYTGTPGWHSGGTWPHGSRVLGRLLRVLHVVVAVAVVVVTDTANMLSLRVYPTQPVPHTTFVPRPQPHRLALRGPGAMFLSTLDTHTGWHYAAQARMRVSPMQPHARRLQRTWKG